MSIEHDRATAVSKAVGSPEFQAQSRKIIEAEMTKLTAKYGEKYAPLIEIFATSGEVMDLIGRIAQVAGGGGGMLAMVMESSFRTIIAASCALADVQQAKAKEIAMDIQQMRTHIRDAMYVAAEVHVATAEASSATMQ